MIWIGAAAIAAALILVGLGFLAFWPEFPPIDDTPIPGWMRDTGETEARHRADRGRRGLRRKRVAVLDDNLDEAPEETPQTPLTPRPPQLLDPASDEWMWTPAQRDHRLERGWPEHIPPTPEPPAHHRYEHIGQETQRLQPPPPEWPPRRPS